MAAALHNISYSKNKSQTLLPLETKNTQNYENRRFGLIESLHMQPCSLRGCIRPLAPAYAVFDLPMHEQKMPASVAQLDAPSDWRPGGRGFNTHRGRQHSFVEIDHEIFSTVILSLPLIQEGQLSVSGEKMCTILVNRLED